MYDTVNHTNASYNYASEGPHGYIAPLVDSVSGNFYAMIGLGKVAKLNPNLSILGVKTMTASAVLSSADMDSTANKAYLYTRYATQVGVYSNRPDDIYDVDATDGNIDSTKFTTYNLPAGVNHNLSFVQGCTTNSKHLMWNSTLGANQNGSFPSKFFAYLLNGDGTTINSLFNDGENLSSGAPVKLPNTTYYDVTSSVSYIGIHYAHVACDGLNSAFTHIFADGSVKTDFIKQ